ncbi:hypothetical protein CONCODRAFT_2699 [Conidiobolus coronatus NRRL 28638]|uniref:Arrestin-like N-terminal domain-containing protein n=1 Tax=Conidiobolus coronatus (strain ATCC 28846 / CBS 209.66 / NRRL 28638) TaxID=796925 RepID=A0A137PH32_CONC2|nr:hypothetical protein CONCODRAFT_2699 [Conidiobolus coronatus NRRL 28638]|eukprot:KXN74314.1 hypothetical protein CONCODRAFT_2699 [Conidiobolus coronatus NRRL 28638]
MFKDLKQFVTSLTHSDIKASIELLSDDIVVPEKSEEFEQFSVQGNLIIDSLITKHIKNISIHFNGNLDNLQESSFEHQKSSIIHNQLELLSEPIDISVGCSVFGFEFALPRTLPSSVNSRVFKLKYDITAFIIFEDDTKLTKKLSVNVYNNYLLPHRGIRECYYENSGMIKDLIEWELIFATRLFNVGDYVNFIFNIKPKKGVIISAVAAKIIQNSLIYPSSSNSDNSAEEGSKPTTQAISQDSYYITNKQSDSILNFNLPISSKHPINGKPALVPTMETQYFEIGHRIQIQLDYTSLKDNSMKVCNLLIPIGITNNSKNFELNELLPNYENFDVNSTVLPARELPPIYSI